MSFDYGVIWGNVTLLPWDKLLGLRTPNN